MPSSTFYSLWFYPGRRLASPLRRASARRPIDLAPTVPSDVDSRDRPVPHSIVRVIVRVWVPAELPSAIGRHPDVAGTRGHADRDIWRCYDHGRNRDNRPNCNHLCGRPRPTDSQQPHSDRNCEHRFPNHTILQKLVPVGRSNGRDVKEELLLAAGWL